MSKVLTSAFGVLARRGYTVRAGQLSMAPGTTLQEYLWAGLEDGNARDALFCPETGRKIGYERLRKASGGFASWLSGNSGGHLSVLLPNSVEMVVASLGALEAGVPLATLDPESSSEEIYRSLEKMETDWLVTKSSLIHNVLEAKRRIEEEAKKEYPLGIITIDDDIIFSGVPHLADLSETSGTAKRRGDKALVTQSWSDAGQVQTVASTASLIAGCMQTTWAGLGVGDRLAASVPMFTRYGLCQGVLNGLAAGAELVILPPGYDLSTAVQRYGVVAAAAVPSAFGRGGGLQGLRALTVAGQLGAAECPAGVQVMQHHSAGPEGPTVFSQQAEAGGPARLGQPVAGTEARVTAGGGAVGPMCEGQIWARGPQLGDEWALTGDSGYYDAEGNFYLTCGGWVRRRQGLGVWPQELEAVLRSNPSVHSAAVFGLPKDRLVAAVVPADPYSPPSATSVSTWLAARTAPHKRLTDVVFTSSLPMTAEGRPDRAALASRYRSGQEYAAVASV